MEVPDANLQFNSRPFAKFASKFSKSILLSFIVIAGSLVFARAQSPPPLPTNSILQLLLSQPPVDISSPVIASASFDPPVVGPGEKSVYRVTLNALQASAAWPETIAAPSQLKLHPGARGEILQPFGGALRPLTSFIYHARAAEPGLLTIPAFTVEVYGKPVLIPKAQLDVRSELPAPHEPARQLEIQCAATNAFTGETLAVRVLLPASPSNMVQGVAQAQLNGDGFLVNKNIMRQSIETLQRNGRNVPTYICEMNVTPIAAGQLALSAQGFAVGRNFSGPIVIQGQAILAGGQPEYILLDSDPITINVRPLPTEGKLPGFTGAIGKFGCDPPQLSTNTVAVGSPASLSLNVRGQGDLSRLVPPPPPLSKDWQIFAAAPGVRTAAGTNQGVSFTYTLIPLTDEVRTTPAIPFSSFDPKQAAYVDLTVPPVPVTVLASGLPADWEKPSGLADNDLDAEKKPVLSNLAQSRGATASSLVPLQLRAWFPFVQVAPAFAFCGLWLWDQRRRHLERHPEILRRRKARRDLRRQRRLLRRAAHRGEGPAFTQCAVAAMKIACAPHYPAEPRALVGGDVLELLAPAERQGRTAEIVRRFFAAADASAFSAAPPGDGELLALQSELNELLVKLEERL